MRKHQRQLFCEWNVDVFVKHAYGQLQLFKYALPPFEQILKQVNL